MPVGNCLSRPISPRNLRWAAGFVGVCPDSHAARQTRPPKTGRSIQARPEQRAKAGLPNCHSCGRTIRRSSRPQSQFQAGMRVATLRESAEGSAPSTDRNMSGPTGSHRLAPASRTCASHLLRNAHSVPLGGDETTAGKIAHTGWCRQQQLRCHSTAAAVQIKTKSAALGLAGPMNIMCVSR